MSINKKFLDEFINVTEKAALGAYGYIGKKDKIAADKAAVDTMRSELNQINMKGKIVIESGSIAKKDDGEMIVNITTSSLGLRGTRIDVDLKPDGKSNISLAADSFGNVGSIDVTSGGQTSSNTSTEQVLEI